MCPELRIYLLTLINKINQVVKSFIFLIPVSVNEEGEDIYTLESIQLFVSSACDLYFRDEDLKRKKKK